MKNGEKLCIDFPNMRYSINISEHRITTTIGVAASFDLDWWNAEYQEPTTKNDLGVDCISRKSVIEEMEKRHTKGDYITKGFINNLPSVTPIRPEGHWIPVYQGDEIIDYRCSECEFGNTFGKGTIGMNFCPRCGSYNGGASNGNE